jgi:AP2-associated kinase
MRRGRPKATAHIDAPAQGSSDPFAALDSSDYKARVAAADELSSKFPSLDEFALLHDQGTKFQFGAAGQASPVPSSTTNRAESLQKRVAEVLADEAFAKPKFSHTGPAAGLSIPSSSPSLKPQKSLDRTGQSASRSQPALLHQPSPQKPRMVSTGTMTAPSPSPPVQNTSDVTQRPIWRIPSEKDPPPRFDSLSKRTTEVVERELPPRPEPTSHRPKFLERARTKSQTGLSTSSRPSLEGQRPSLEYLEPIDRSKSANAKPRPASLFMDSPPPDLPRGKAALHDRNIVGSSKTSPSPRRVPIDPPSSDDEGPDDHITSDVAFLRHMESPDDPGKVKDRRRSSGSKKRTSIPSISLTGTKNILAGRFGDAFRRFETNSGSNASAEPDYPDREALRPNAPLSPIMGSEATGTSGRSDEDAIDETQDLPPEVRRELERRRLSQEEKRVAAAAAEYRERLQRGGAAAPGPSRASTIQNRVKSLLGDVKTAAPASRTAEGYGRYTDRPKSPDKPSIVSRKPVSTALPMSISATERVTPRYASNSLPSSVVSHEYGAGRVPPKPSVAPKPAGLRTGTPDLPQSQPVSYRLPTSSADDEWETNFAKKYPSLSGIEMVETEIQKMPPTSSRVRDV